MTQTPNIKYKPPFGRGFFYIIVFILIALPNFLAFFVNYSTTSDLWINLVYSWLPFVLFILLMIFIGKQYGKSQVGKPQAHAEVLPEPRNEPLQTTQNVLSQNQTTSSPSQTSHAGNRSPSGDAWRYVLLALAFIAFIYFMFKEEIDRLLFI